VGPTSPASRLYKTLLRRKAWRVPLSEASRFSKVWFVGFTITMRAHERGGADLEASLIQTSTSGQNLRLRKSRASCRLKQIDPQLRGLSMYVVTAQNHVVHSLKTELGVARWSELACCVLMGGM
jgi:hypothetical protein